MEIRNLRLLFASLGIIYVIPTNGNEVVLYDSSKQGGSLNWTSIASPKDGLNSGWTETSVFSQNISTSPLKVYTSCSPKSADVNNWLQTPFVEVRNAMSLYMKIDFTMKRCLRHMDPGSLQHCRESFNLYFYQAYSDITTTRLPQLDANSYTLIDKLVAGSVVKNASDLRVNSERRFISLRQGSRGIYFAFQDNGACVTIVSIKVFYKECPDMTLNYAYFPATPTGNSQASTVEREGICVPHASLVQKPTYSCQSDATWIRPTGSCRCDPEFEGKDNNCVTNHELSTLPAASTIQRLLTSKAYGTYKSTFRTWLSTSYSTTYNHNTLSGFKQTEGIRVNCNAYSWNITINLPLLRTKYPKLVNSDIYLGENKCTGIETDRLLVFQYGLDECLTNEVIQDGGNLYNNVLVYAEHDPVYTFIIKHFNWTIPVECNLSKNNSVTGVIQSNDTNLVLPKEQYPANVSTYLDSSFIKEVPKNPLHADVGSRIYVKVFSTTSDWNTYIRVRTCYTKPTANASDHLKYYLIKNGCEQVTTTHIVYQTTHETRFMFDNFEYIGRRNEGIYIFCNVTFCTASEISEQCLQTCNPII